MATLSCRHSAAPRDHACLTRPRRRRRHPRWPGAWGECIPAEAAGPHGGWPSQGTPTNSQSLRARRTGASTVPWACTGRHLHHCVAPPRGPPEEKAPLHCASIFSRDPPWQLCECPLCGPSGAHPSRHTTPRSAPRALPVLPPRDASMRCDAHRARGLVDVGRVGPPHSDAMTACAS